MRSSVTSGPAPKLITWLIDESSARSVVHEKLSHFRSSREFRSALSSSNPVITKGGRARVSMRVILEVDTKIGRTADEQSPRGA